MIHIDYIGGAHGNFLEYVCNTHIAGITSTKPPFKDTGTSHLKSYTDDKLFEAEHYAFFNKSIPPGRIVSIQVAPDDLLQLLSISLLRANEYNLDNDELEVNTYNKLNNHVYRWVLDELIEKFSANQVEKGYNAIKDSSWPNIKSKEDYDSLPEHIRRECEDVHGFVPFELSEKYPDCPRYILREFFKYAFLTPDTNKLILYQVSIDYSGRDVYYWPYACFYDTEWFTKELEFLATWLNMPCTDATKLHEEFLKRQPYLLTKKVCDELLQRIYDEEVFDLPKLDLLQESYINAQLELYFDKEIPDHQTVWYKNTQEIYDYFNE